MDLAHLENMRQNKKIDTFEMNISSLELKEGIGLQ